MDRDIIGRLDTDGESDYTDEEIERLIRCAKRVVQPPRKTMRDRQGSLRNEMTIESVEEGRHFYVFMRQNIDFNENFSIGLRFLASDGGQQICLIRFNGPHAHRELKSDSEQSHWHASFHIHKAKVENISAGLKEDQFAFKTDRYASFQEAQAEFFREINLTDALDYFPLLGQLSFDLRKEEQ